MTAIKMMRKIPRNDAARNPVTNPVGFEATAVGLETRLARDPPIISTPTIPATMAQTMLQRRTTNPLPNAKPQPTMKHPIDSHGYLREHKPSPRISQRGFFSLQYSLFFLILLRSHDKQ